MLEERRAITSFGGGRGQSTTLEAITLYHPESETNGVTTSGDDGNDSGRKRQIGMALRKPVIPPGDLRRCLVSVADPLARPQLSNMLEYRHPEDSGSFDGKTFREVAQMAHHMSLRDRGIPLELPDYLTNGPAREAVLNYKFTKEWGELDHSCLGNTLITVSELISGDGQKGIDTVRDLLRVKGGLAPISLVAGDLRATYGLSENPDTHIHLNGESQLDHIDAHPRYHPDMLPIDLSYLHRLPLNERVKEFVERSQGLVFSVGSWYTSLMANLMVDDCVGVIENAKTFNTLEINLFWSRGEAHHLRSVSDYVADFHERTEGRIPIHRIVANDSEAIPLFVSPEAIASYEAEGKRPVKGDSEEERKAKQIYPSSQVLILPLARQLQGSTMVGHYPPLLGRAIVHGIAQRAA